MFRDSGTSRPTWKLRNPTELQGAMDRKGTRKKQCVSPQSGRCSGRMARPSRPEGGRACPRSLTSHTRAATGGCEPGASSAFPMPQHTCCDKPLLFEVWSLNQSYQHHLEPAGSAASRAPPQTSGVLLCGLTRSLRGSGAPYSLRSPELGAILSPFYR